MISKTIGFRGTLFSDKPKSEHFLIAQLFCTVPAIEKLPCFHTQYTHMNTPFPFSDQEKHTTFTGTCDRTQLNLVKKEHLQATLKIQRFQIVCFLQKVHSFHVRINFSRQFSQTNCMSFTTFLLNLHHFLCWYKLINIPSPALFEPKENPIRLFWPRKFRHFLPEWPLVVVAPGPPPWPRTRWRLGCARYARNGGRAGVQRSGPGPGKRHEVDEFIAWILTN